MSQLNVGKLVASTEVVFPTYTNSNRPVSATQGSLIFNSEESVLQLYTGTEWVSLQNANPQDFSNVTIFNYTGSDQSFSVPTTGGTVNELLVFMWGAGGGADEGGTATAGAGGYASGTISRFDGQSLNGDAFTIVVGQGGLRGVGGSNMSAMYGGGGRGSVDSGGGHVSGCGGGLSGIFAGTAPVFSGANPQGGAQARAIIVAGGGGGCNDQTTNFAYGGSGGGIEGGRGGSEPTNNNKGGWGGRQVSGYSGSNSSATYANGSELRGADGPSNTDNPGGGGGYWGGQSGGDDNSGAGGGSGYTGGTSTYKVVSGLTTNGGSGTSSSGYNPPETGSEYYSAGVGSAYRTQGGGNGKVVVLY